MKRWEFLRVRGKGRKRLGPQPRKPAFPGPSCNVVMANNWDYYANYCPDRLGLLWLGLPALGKGQKYHIQTHGPPFENLTTGHPEAKFLGVAAPKLGFCLFWPVGRGRPPVHLATD